MKVRYYGHVGQQTGYGRSASDMCMALLRAGVELQIRPLAPPKTVHVPDEYLPLASLIHREATLDPNPDAIIVHTLPLDCAHVIEAISSDPRTDLRARLIAYTTWEANLAPGLMRAKLDEHFDQVWSPSVASANALAMGGRSALVVPHCFDEEHLHLRRTTVLAGGPLPMRDRGRFRFYYVGAWTSRKNPAALVRTFAHTFTGNDNVELYLHCSGLNPLDFARAVHGTGIAPNEMPAIHLSGRPLTDREMIDLHAEADCFVTASHGEAWNLPAFDALLAGRHVIAPMGQGSDEFLKGTSCDRYRCTKTIPQLDVNVRQVENMRVDLSIVGAQGLTARETWDEPDLLELSAYMRSAAIHRVRTMTVSYDPIARFGYTAVGKLALQHLETP